MRNASFFSTLYVTAPLFCYFFLSNQLEVMLIILENILGNV